MQLRKLLIKTLKMEKSVTRNTKVSATEKKGGKAARVKRMRRGNTKTAEVRESNNDLLYGEKDVK